jgi:hypothetical protein
MRTRALGRPAWADGRVAGECSGPVKRAGFVCCGTLSNRISCGSAASRRPFSSNRHVGQRTAGDDAPDIENPVHSTSKARPGRAVLWRAALRTDCRAPADRRRSRQLPSYGDTRASPTPTPVFTATTCISRSCRHRNPRRARVCLARVARGADSRVVPSRSDARRRRRGRGRRHCRAGIVDAFLGFTATYILIAITLGPPWPRVRWGGAWHR